jgi:hypothetical protein
MKKLRRTLALAGAAVVAASALFLASPASPALASSTALSVTTDHNGTCYGTYTVSQQANGLFVSQVDFRTNSSSYGCTLQVYASTIVSVVAQPNTAGRLYVWYYNYDFVRLCQSGDPGKCTKLYE